MNLQNKEKYQRRGEACAVAGTELLQWHWVTLGFVVPAFSLPSLLRAANTFLSSSFLLFFLYQNLEGRCRVILDSEIWSKVDACRLRRAQGPEKPSNGDSRNRQVPWGPGLGRAEEPWMWYDIVALYQDCQKGLDSFLTWWLGNGEGANNRYWFWISKKQWDLLAVLELWISVKTGEQNPENRQTPGEAGTWGTLHKQSGHGQSIPTVGQRLYLLLSPALWIISSPVPLSRTKIPLHGLYGHAQVVCACPSH